MGAAMLCSLVIVERALCQADTAPLPQWIWSDAERSGDGDGIASFQKNFAVHDRVLKAEFRLAVDFCRVEVLVNDQVVAVCEAFDPNRVIEVRGHLTGGDNVVALRAVAVDGPSALAAELTIDYEGGGHSRIATDASWKPGEGGAVSHSFGVIDPRRWAMNELPAIGVFAEYNQWKDALPENDAAASREQLSALPEGFEIERLRTAQADEGSWVNMTFDPRGRLIIGKESRGLLRMTLPDSEAGGIGVVVIDDRLEECRGLTFRGDDLFANANRSKAMYRLRDTSGDDQFDEVTKLQETEGSTGHGRNDLALGPDGAIHAIHGDSVIVPENATRLAAMEPEGEAPEALGHWLRTKAEGQGDWQVLARGLRNPYGIDFNADGEAFTYDADNEGDVGLPFYRPTRINHLVPGANYGWHQLRGNTRSLPVYAPDSVPTTFDVGRGSPTAVRFGTGSDFPEPYRSALFALDWAYGRIITVHLTPRGASYYASGETFLEGRPLNVTDLDFGPDGAMYFVTGGRKTQSALFRIRYTGAVRDAAVATAQSRARQEFSERSRRQRRKLEHYLGRYDTQAVEQLWPHLGSADPWLRNVARVALESQPLNEWLSKIGRGDGGLRALTAQLALVRTGSDTDRQAALVNLHAMQPVNWSRTERLTILRTIEICRDQIADADTKLVQELADTLGGWYPAPDDATNRELCRVLGLLSSPLAVTAGLERMASAAEQMEQLHYLEMLSEAPAGWNAARRQRFFGALLEAERSSLGDRFMVGFFDDVKRHALANVEDDAERAGFAERLENAGQNGAQDFGAAPARQFVRHWTLADFSGDALAEGVAAGDKAKGRELYRAALCNRCHVSGNEGRAVGPDLSTVGRRFSPADLLESIIEPSKVVSEVHRNVTLNLKDGSSVHGRIVGDDFRKSLLTVATNPFDPADRREVNKVDVVNSSESPVSPMPPALIDTLTRQEVFDLLAWLIAGEP